MHLRRDALAGAAEWIGRVEAAAHDMHGVVATVGRAVVSPCAANVIPARCQTTVDVRHADDAIRLGTLERLQASAREIAARRGLDLTWHTYLDQAATVMDASLVAALERAVSSSGVSPLLMSSGAGHDAMVVAAHMPAAMLFVRSPGGISHHPAERVLDEDVSAALAAGVCFIDLLADARRRGGAA